MTPKLHTQKSAHILTEDIIDKKSWPINVRGKMHRMRPNDAIELVKVRDEAPEIILREA